MPLPKDSGLPNALGIDSDYMTADVHSDTYPAISPLKHDLRGKIVFITGASKGIGRAFAVSYAQAGASGIVIGARSDLSAVEEAVYKAAAEAKREKPSVLKLQLDVGSLDSVKKAAEDIEKKFGRLDIVINNAAALIFAPVLDSDPDEWWNVWEVNVRGSYYVARSLLPLLLKSENGDKQIVNVASVGAHLRGLGGSAYQTSKLALVRFSEFLQVEYGSQGLLCFSIHPCNSDTGILSPIGGVPEHLKHVVIDTPEVASDSTVFLTATKRSWLGGRYINCTWDMPQLMEMEQDIVKGDKLKVKLHW